MEVKLHIKGDEQGEREVVFDRPGEFILGRFKEADVFVDDPKVSKRHCALVITPQGARIADLFSANGTIVDGRPLGGDPTGKKRQGLFEHTVYDEGDKSAFSSQVEAEIQNGSVIRIGAAEITVRIQYDPGSNPENAKLYLDCKKKLAEIDAMLTRIKKNNPSDQRVEALMKAVTRLKQWVELEC